MVMQFFPKNEIGDLRKFALRLEVFLQVFGFLFLRHRFGHHYGVWPVLWLAGLGPAWIFPQSLRSVRRFLQTLSRWVGTAVTTVILTLVYFLVLTPLGFAAKIFGKKFLDLKWDPDKPSYWARSDGSKSSPERQY